MGVEQVYQTFLDESREMLSDMERLLLEVEDDPADSESCNALFRCVHTIKGSAGMFGFEHLVGFTHVVENVLDRLRAGQIGVDRHLTQLLLRCRDHISALLHLDNLEQDPQLAATQRSLLGELTHYQATGLSVADRPADGQSAAVAVTHQPTERIQDDQDKQASRSTSWHIEVSFHEDVLRHGMDPLGFIAFLGRLGEIQEVICDTSQLPLLEVIDPEACYLSFSLTLEAECQQKDIEEVFEFVEELCELKISRLSSTPFSLQDAYAAAAQMEPAQAGAQPRQLTGTEAEALGPDLSAARSRGTAAPEVAQTAPQGAERPARQPLGGHSQQRPIQALRVPAGKLDRLINLVGEMVIASSAVDLQAGRSTEQPLREAVERMSALVQEVRDSCLELRSGSVVPVLDLSARLGRGASTIHRRSCIVILELSADDYGGVGEGSYQELGVVVDEVAAVQEVPEGDIEPPVSFGARVRTEFMGGMAKIEGRFVIVLDAYRITDVDEIASLAAALDADDMG